jgi:hypothetical protein
VKLARKRPSRLHCDSWASGQRRGVRGALALVLIVANGEPGEPLDLGLIVERVIVYANS